MVNLLFRRKDDQLIIEVDGKQEVYPAANNVDSGSRGPWPPGEYVMHGVVVVTGKDGAPSGAYGRWFLEFPVLGRSGMGLHAGREGDTDGLGREGWRHATRGCIRTTAEAMRRIVALHHDRDEGVLMKVE